MALALYHPELGYYASRGQRSGRAGDFYTSVDVGAIFGELIAVQIAEMAAALTGPFDLVEAAAGSGRLMRDVLDALQREAPDVYGRARVHLVERSAAARAAQPATLAPHAAKIAGAGSDVPPSFGGVLFANELLDALPVHVVAMQAGAPREIVVDAEGETLVARPGPVPGAEVLRELQAGPPLDEGALAEINLAGREWLLTAASRLERGFVLLIDYGDTTAALRSPARREGTLRAFRGHQVSGRWLDAPGEQDLTSHVDFTALERWGREAGLVPMGRTDQTRFLLALGALERMPGDDDPMGSAAALRRRLGLKALLVPGGIGSTHQVAIFGKNVGRQVLTGLSLAR